MAAIPLTRIPASPEKARAIRAALRAVAFPAAGARIIAAAPDADRFFALIKDPAISAPIYTLPKPVTLETSLAFITRHIEEKARGEGLLILDLDENGAVAGYHDIQIWPEWSAAELGGAIRTDRQGAGQGGAGAAAAFAWLFGVIGVDLICETAALDNIRTHRLLERIGFRRVGEIDSDLPGGGVRRSVYFELARSDWDQARSSNRG
ncbi:MAG: GNAT family N-acetyltransferase [Parvularculaceae bacterium]